MSLIRSVIAIVFSLCFINLKAQQTQSLDSLKIPIMNYRQLQERYFDIQSDSTIVLNFWATWCMPCQLEMPYFEQLGREFSDKKIKIIFVTIDVSEQIEDKVKSFLALNNIKSEVVSFQDKIAPTKLLPLMCPNWSGTIPVTIVMNKTDGTYFETSFSSYEKLKEVILPYVKQ